MSQPIYDPTVSYKVLNRLEGGTRHELGKSEVSAVKLFLSPYSTSLARQGQRGITFESQAIPLEEVAVRTAVYELGRKANEWFETTNDHNTLRMGLYFAAVGLTGSGDKIAVFQREAMDLAVKTNMIEDFHPGISLVDRSLTAHQLGLKGVNPQGLIRVGEDGKLWSA